MLRKFDLNLPKGEIDLSDKKKEKIVYEDISSTSPEPVVDAAKKTKRAAKKAAKVAKRAADSYANATFKNIDKAIKIIAFVVAASFFLVFLLGAAVLYLMDKSLIFLCALILVLGAAISLIFLFLIYGIGHIISQNKEILKKLNF